MAHFAEIDASGTVLRVLVVPDEVENRGHEYLSGDLMLGGVWVQCSYNAKIRKNYPGAGYVYDAGRDAFIPPKPFDSWLLDEETCQWVSPLPMPSDGRMYGWSEQNGWETQR